MTAKKHILPTIVFAQFCCTSLWFAGNAVISELILKFNLLPSALGHLTSAVQFGFISGTLCFALLSIADRFSPSKVFFYCALLAALTNLGMLLPSNTLTTLLIWRFLVGFFLAGIYPVGMKIAADYFQKGLGTSLGFLVGALVLGTAFPHLINGLDAGLSAITVVATTSGLSVLGGLSILLLVPDGPYRKAQSKLDMKLIPKLFKNRKFKSAAFGYFGHMWELYTFWAFVPVMLSSFLLQKDQSITDVPFWSFFIIAIGSLGCIAGAYISRRFGEQQTAFCSLVVSGLCCLLFPVVYAQASPELFIGYLLFWGIFVIADSPLFSTMVANATEPQSKGTALTIVNCLGFSLTIVSIQSMAFLSNWLDIKYLFMILAIGPLCGISYFFFAKLRQYTD